MKLDLNSQLQNKDVLSNFIKSRPDLLDDIDLSLFTNDDIYESLKLRPDLIDKFRNKLYLLTCIQKANLLCEYPNIYSSLFNTKAFHKNIKYYMLVSEHHSLLGDELPNIRKECMNYALGIFDAKKTIFDESDVIDAIIDYPETINRYDTDKFSESAVVKILSKHQNLVDCFDLSELSVKQWVSLLSNSPDLHDYCHTFNTFTDSDMNTLAKKQRKYFDLFREKLSYGEQLQIVIDNTSMFTDDEQLEIIQIAKSKGYVVDSIINDNDIYLNKVPHLYDRLLGDKAHAVDDYFWVKLLNNIEYVKLYIRKFGIDEFMNRRSDFFIIHYPHLIDKEEITIEDLGI